MAIKEEVQSTIEQFFYAMDTQNITLMQQLIPKSEKTVHIGTDDGEVWKGWQVLNEATLEQFKALEYYKADIQDLTINVSDSGDTAWYFHMLDAEIKSNGEIIRLKEARFTGVVNKQNGRWIIAQTHVSVPESS